MFRIDWRIVVGILVGILIIALIFRLTRNVSPFHPAGERLLDGWGSLDSNIAQQLQVIIDEDVNSLKVPGLQVFVRTANGQTWSGVSGTTDLERKNLLRRDHILRIGSVTKTFTAVLILKLVEDGKLKLDDAVGKWFPQIPKAEAITIRQLLNHSSGIPEIIPKVLMKSIIPSTVWSSEELVTIIADDKLAFPPGSDFGYSNSNYILLGLIAEKVSGRSFGQLLRERVLTPLNLTHTYFVPYEPTPAALVSGYDRDLSSMPGMLDIERDNTSWATSAFASGAMASNAEDVGVFYESLFGGKLLSPAMMTEMTTFIPASNPGFPEQNGYGLGVMRIEVDDQELVGHVGQFMGSTAIAMYAPDKQYLIVVTCNLSYPPLVKVLSDLQVHVR